jgi:Leucine-rich repeat (LRR) protein
MTHTSTAIKSMDNSSSYDAQKRIDKWIQLNDPSRELDLSYLGLTKLPKIPSNCQILYCNNNKLTVLPELPNCQTLYCQNNQLTILPELPNYKILYCSDNQLTVLPELPNCRTLYCSYNKLTVLPELPNCQTLSCYNNQLTVLPELPNCQTLSCYNNQLTVLPELPNCQTLYCYNNQYLWITKRHSRKLNKKATPNYTKFARIIQRKYRRHMRVKYTELLDSYLFKGPTGIVCAYVC